MKRTLVLFTSNHPFTYTGGETMFVGPELPHLARAFGNVKIVPLRTDGTMLPLPGGVTLDATLAQGWRRWRPLYYLLAPIWPLFWGELLRALRKGGWRGPARVWRWAAVAVASWRWMQSNLTGQAPMLLYTYWRGGQTLASVRWAQSHPECAVVCRVHGYDLYEEAFRPPFQPWTSIYQSVNRVLLVAGQARDYLLARGVASKQLTLARLGVAAAQARAEPSRDGVIRVVSCSYVTQGKRVALCARVLEAFAARHCMRRIEWVHFGDGPAMSAVRSALLVRPQNLQAILRGQVPNAQVLEHYVRRPVDAFMLLSESEGLPVSIQEALAHGIPVLATNVGGVAEAVDPLGENGLLVPVDASIDVMVDALERLVLCDPRSARAHRDAAWRRWQRDFDAERNHSRLAAVLTTLESERWS